MIAGQFIITVWNDFVYSTDITYILLKSSCSVTHFMLRKKKPKTPEAFDEFPEIITKS